MGKCFWKFSVFGYNLLALNWIYLITEWKNELLAEYIANRGSGLSGNCDDMFIIIPRFWAIIFGSMSSIILVQDIIFKFISVSLKVEAIFVKYSGYSLISPTLLTNTSINSIWDNSFSILS